VLSGDEGSDGRPLSHSRLRRAALGAGGRSWCSQWIASGYLFHVVRDHVPHNELIVGCLRAGRTDCGNDVVALMRSYFAAAPTASAASYGR
jgi:hypothetical protein